MPAPKPTPTVFYARDKSPLEDPNGPRRSVEDEEPLVNVVSDIVDHESHDEEYGTPASIHSRASSAHEKRFLSPNEEDSGDASIQTMKPPAKRQRRAHVKDSATPRRSGRISSAATTIKDEKPSVVKAPIKRGRGRPPTKAKMNPTKQVEEPLAVKAAIKRGRGRPPARPKTSRRASEAEWEVEKVLGSQIDAESSEHFYLVKWKGFTNKENTWEPKRNLGNCRKLIQDFESIKH